MKSKKQSVLERFKNDRKLVLLWLFLRLLVIATMVLSIIRKQPENVFTCVLVLILFVLPAIVEKKLKVEFPSGFLSAILIFIFCAEILGEIACYYIQYPNWDTLLHTTWGFLCAACGYSLVDILNKSNNIHFRMSPIFLAISAFCFSMTVGVLWEFFEFSVDRLFLKDMQKDTVVQIISSVYLDPTNSNIPIVIKDITGTAVNDTLLPINGYLDIGLYDTMEDLFVNFIGAIVFSVFGYIDAKRRRYSFTEKIVPRLRDEENE